jgi:hypothetical protein
MNSNVKTIVLAVVIVACLGFVVLRLVGSGDSSDSEGEAGGPGTGEYSFYCTACNEVYNAEISEGAFMPLQMAGIQSNPKHPCPKCSKPAGVPAMNCPACSAQIPSPGMAALSGQNPRMRAVCPKCKAPLAESPQG